MSTKQQLRQLVDLLPDDQVPAAHRILHALIGDPVVFSLLTAPEDDELDTDEHRTAADQARQEIARGEAIPFDQVKQEFGLK